MQLTARTDETGGGDDPVAVLGELDVLQANVPES
jgi:hypothetical protein